MQTIQQNHQQEQHQKLQQQKLETKLSNTMCGLSVCLCTLNKPNKKNKRENGSQAQYGREKERANDRESCWVKKK